MANYYSDIGTGMGSPTLGLMNNPYASYLQGALMSGASPLAGGSGGLNYSPVPTTRRGATAQSGAGVYYTPVPQMGASNPNAWLYQQMYQTGRSPLAGVPEEYWQDALSAMDAALPWEQLRLSQAARQDSAANQAEANRIAWARIAQDAAQSGDAQRLAWAQQGLRESELALQRELGLGGLDIQRGELDISRGNLDLARQRLGLDTRQLDAQMQQAGAAQMLARDQFGLSQELGRGNLNLSQAQLAEQIRAAQAAEGLQNRQFGLSQQQVQDQREQNRQQLARQRMLDQFDMALRQGTLDYQKQADQQNRDLQREMAAYSTFGRRIAPNAMAL